MLFDADLMFARLPAPADKQTVKPRQLGRGLHGLLEHGVCGLVRRTCLPAGARTNSDRECQTDGEAGI